MALPTQSIERLKEYLAQLSPKSQALLLRAFESALERGEDVKVASLVLELLRSLVRASEVNERARTEELSRQVFRPLEPFLVDNRATVRPGQIRRESLNNIWNWLKQEGLAAEIAEFEASDLSTGAALEAAVRKLQVSAAAAIGQLVAPAALGGADQRSPSRIGGAGVVEDLHSVSAVLNCREALDGLSARVGGSLRNLTESQLVSIQEAMELPPLQSPQGLPFALSLVIQKLVSPWQVIRLAVAMAGSDDEFRVAATSYGISVTMVIHDLSNLVADLGQEMRHGRIAGLSHRLKTIHDGLRGLRTELDIRNDSPWGKRLSSIRVEISNILRAQIEGVPGRVRRLLRQRPDKEINAGMRLDPMDIDETADLIDFVAVCRTYASELAINEVTLRTFSDIQHYTETATEALVESLRASENTTRPFRMMQVDAAIRFCDVLFGEDYASLMRKAAEMAVAGDRKSARTA